MRHSYRLTIRFGSVVLSAGAALVPITSQSATLTFAGGYTLSAGAVTVPITSRTANLVLGDIGTPFTGAEFTSLLLSAPVAGSYPYEAAVYPLKGEVPTGYSLASVDDTTLRASILSTWDDGSAAVMVVSGQTTLTANGVKPVALKAVTATGTDLTVSRITTLLSSVTVNFTATYGGSASAVLGSPERVWWANPQVICARYRIPAPTPGSTALEAVVDVHCYSGPWAFVEAVIENGKVVVGSSTLPASASYTGMTIAVNGTTIATVNSPSTTVVRGATLYAAGTHEAFRAFYASGWVGGDPGVLVTHDTGYLGRHPLLPLIDQPTAVDFSRTDQNAFGLIPGTMTYTPWTIAEQRPSMSVGGDDQSLGLFPKWDMQYLQSGNRYAANAVRVNSLAAISYPINYRDSTTGVLPTFAQTSAVGAFRNFGLAQVETLPYWDIEHPPAISLVAFLTRPSPVYIELAQKAAFWQMTGSQFETFDHNWAGRSKAWGMRAVSHAAFLTPTTLPSGGSRSASEVTAWRTAALDCIGRNVTRVYNAWIGAPLRSNPLRVMYSGTPSTATTDEAWDDDVGEVPSLFETAMWQPFWFAAAMHRIDKSALMASHSTATQLSTLVDWLSTTPAKMVNEATGGEWRYNGKLNTVGSVGGVSNTVDVGDPGIYATWAAAYLARRGAAPALAGTFQYNFGEVQKDYLVATWDPETGPRDMTNSYSVIFVEALATAAERGVTGASTAWATVLANITNWSTWRTGLRTDPRASHYPRTLTGAQYINPQWPAWRRAMVPGTWTKVGGVMNAVNPEFNSALNPYFGGTGPTYGSPPTKALSPWHNLGSGPNPINLDSSTLGTEGFIGVCDDWCGAAFDKDNDRLYVWGGGHQAYGGNEVLSIGIADASPAYRLERPPTGSIGYGQGIILADQQESAHIYSNGDPRSGHSYDLLAWASGKLYAVSTACFANPSGRENTTAQKLFAFTPSASPGPGSYGTWAHVATLPSATTGVSWNSCTMYYDETRTSIVVRSHTNAYTWNINTGLWTTSASLTATDQEMRSVRIPSLDVTVTFNYVQTAKFTVYSPSTNSDGNPGATGTAPSVSIADVEYYATAEWVPELGAIVCWIEAGTGFHLLTPPVTGNLLTTPWAWSRLEASAANSVTPDAHNTNGDFGRFFYSPRLKCLGVVTATNTGVQQGGQTSTGQLNIFALP